MVPIMMLASSILMAFAWLGHIRLRDMSFARALLASWFLVLPEYMLNVGAIRWGYGVYQGGEMAAMNLSFGVVCVALVARFFLREPLRPRQIFGFGLMAIGVAMVVA